MERRRFYGSCGIPSSSFLLLLLLIMSSSSPARGLNHGEGRSRKPPGVGVGQEPSSSEAVKLQIWDQYVVIGNGIVEVNLTNPGGQVVGVGYNGVVNLLEVVNHENDRGFIMIHGSSGFYTYTIYEHSQHHPAFELANTRLVIKPRKDIFHEMALSDKKHREMPLPDDRLPPRGRTLDYPEAVLLVDPIEPQFKGQVDDKYEYSMENRDIKVHGWMSREPSVGLWQITPSSEFRSGGPLKQFLASHVGPTNLAVFHSTHYTGADMMIPFEANEPWKKVYGPVFIYLNSLNPPDHKQPQQEKITQLSLWEDAKNQLVNQSKQWPYQFVSSPDYALPSQRGSVTGKLSVLEPQISYDGINLLPPLGALVGLAAPGNPGSWQLESKRYQFWTEVEADGTFRIDNVIAGRYNLYGFVPNFVGEYKYDALIDITPGRTIDVGDVVYQPPRNGSTLWEIGIPDRTAAEFFIPDANPDYINPLYLRQEKYRQYGLWKRYAELYPEADLVYNVHTDDYKKDWFFAQVTRKKDNNGTYQGTTWQVKFKLDVTYPQVNYTLRVALATANGAELQVRVNEPSTLIPLFTTGEIGKDNTIARHGIHRVYRLFDVTVPGSLLVEGSNTIFLMQAVGKGPLYGLMYDYIRFEGPLSPNPRDQN